MSRRPRPIAGQETLFGEPAPPQPKAEAEASEAQRAYVRALCTQLGEPLPVLHNTRHASRTIMRLKLLRDERKAVTSATKQ